jgi:aminoglycoside phosphotransferase (APT) family kinase protein
MALFLSCAEYYTYWCINQVHSVVALRSGKMSRGKPMRVLHSRQVPFDLALARRLIESQIPQYSNLPMILVAEQGTDHVLCRVGGSLVARFPIIDWAAEQVWSDQRWLPFFSQVLPVEVPRQIIVGNPEFEYPFHWSLCTWLEGRPLTPHGRQDSSDLVDQLCDILLRLRAAPTSGAPLAREHRLRGRPLSEKDTETRQAIAQLPEALAAAVLPLWETAVAVLEYRGEPAWFHGDLLPGNVLANGGVIRGVIDFGAPGAGDPSCDLMAAWHLLTPTDRLWLRERMKFSDDEWNRGIGHTLSQAAIYVPYYRETNPEGAQAAVDVLNRLIRER